jgi:Fe-S cluster assembly protein SufD
MKLRLSEECARTLLEQDSAIQQLLECSTERYQYVPLRLLPEFKQPECVTPAIHQASADASGPLHLVMKGGRIVHQHLPTSVECWPLEQARRLLGPSLQRRLDQANEQEPDLMARLAQRLAPEPLVLYIPPRTMLDSPIRVHICSTEGGWSLQRFIVIAGAQADCRIQIEQQSQAITASSWEIWQEESSNVTVEQLDEAPGHWAFTALRAELKRHAHLTWRGASRGGRAVRWDLSVRLLQEGAETDLSGFWSLEGSQVHSHVKVEHCAPSCRSNQLFKGINDEGAVSSFEGLIHVRREAQQTNAYQLNQNLLVHPLAKAFSKPSLDILADDVRATHGSTTGRLDPEQQFYLESRGVPRSQAKRLLTRAFCETLLRDFPETWQGRLISS